MPTFRLVDTADETGAYLPGAYDSGAAAAAAAKEARERGQTLRVVREPYQDEVWKARGRADQRFYSGEWQKLPSFVPAQHEHYLHKSVDPLKADDGKVACYPTLSHLVDDRPVVMSLSRYLARFFASTMSPDAIAKVTQLYAATLEPTTFHVTRDPATVVRAFAGFQHCAESCDYVSCMAKPGPYFGLTDEQHPALAYTGDGSSLSLAYLESSSGVIVARAIVSHENEKFVRVYGLEERHKTSLIVQLEERGWKRSDGWDGERLAKIKHPRGRTAYLMPYIDGETKTLTDNGDGTLTVTEDGEIDGEVTAGWTHLEAAEECAHCGARARRSTMADVQGELWCEDCVESHTWTCDRTGEIHPDSEPSVPVVSRWCTETWHEDVAERYAFFCDYAEEYYTHNAFDRVEVHTPDGLRHWADVNAERYAVWHDETGAYYHPDCVPEDSEDDTSEDDTAQRDLAA